MSKRAQDLVGHAARVVVMAYALMAFADVRAQSPLLDAKDNHDSRDVTEVPAAEGPQPADVSREGAEQVMDDRPTAAMADQADVAPPQPEAGPALQGPRVEDLPPVRMQALRPYQLITAAGFPLLGGLLGVPCLAGMTAPAFACVGLGAGVCVVASVASVGICLTWPCLVFPAIGGALGLPPGVISLALGVALSTVSLGLTIWNGAPTWRSALGRVGLASLAYVPSLALSLLAVATAGVALVLYRVWWSSSRSVTSPIAGIAGRVAGAATWPFGIATVLLAGSGATLLLAAPLMAIVAVWLEQRLNPQFQKQ